MRLSLSPISKDTFKNDSEMNDYLYSTITYKAFKTLFLFCLYRENIFIFLYCKRESLFRHNTFDTIGDKMDLNHWIAS